MFVCCTESTLQNSCQRNFSAEPRRFKISWLVGEKICAKCEATSLFNCKSQFHIWLRVWRFWGSEGQSHRRAIKSEMCRSLHVTITNLYWNWYPVSRGVSNVRNENADLIHAFNFSISFCLFFWHGLSRNKKGESFPPDSDSQTL